MQEHCAATAGDARRRVVINLDDEIIEMIIAPQAVAALLAREPNRLVIVPIARVFAPAVLRRDRADRQEGCGPGETVGTPPQLQRAKNALRGSSIALALIGTDPAAPEGHRNDPIAGDQPASPRI